VLIADVASDNAVTTPQDLSINTRFIFSSVQ